MTPEMSLQTQKTIGADIIMAFDQCTPDSCSKDEVGHILQRTHRWLKQSVQYHRGNILFSYYGYPQALFGIIQGSIFADLRCESADFVASMNTEGIALGGETIGFDMEKTVEVIQWVYSYLPENKPTFIPWGVGMSPQDLIDVVAQGIDMFDCVAPTRNARHGALYCGEIIREGNWLRFRSPYEQERIQIKKACFAYDLAPIMPHCTCYTCQFYSRSCLHHLFKRKKQCIYSTCKYS